MNVFETIIFYLVFIVFPLTLWLLYQAYSKTMNKEKSNIFLDFALFSSMYLIELNNAKTAKIKSV